MYEVFDSFLATGTWHTGHSNDLERFNHALAKVIRNPEFNPDALGEYIRDKKGVTEENEFLDSAVDDRVAAAWAVKEYLEAITHS